MTNYNVVLFHRRKCQKGKSSPNTIGLNNPKPPKACAQSHACQTHSQELLHRQLMRMRLKMTSRWTSIDAGTMLAIKSNSVMNQNHSRCKPFTVPAKANRASHSSMLAACLVPSAVGVRGSGASRTQCSIYKRNAYSSGKVLRAPRRMAPCIAGSR